MQKGLRVSLLGNNSDCYSTQREAEMSVILHFLN